MFLGVFVFVRPFFRVICLESCAQSMCPTLTSCSWAFIWGTRRRIWIRFFWTVNKLCLFRNFLFFFVQLHLWVLKVRVQGFILLLENCIFTFVFFKFELYFVEIWLHLGNRFMRGIMVVAASLVDGACELRSYACIASFCILRIAFSPLYFSSSNFTLLKADCILATDLSEVLWS